MTTCCGGHVMSVIEIDHLAKRFGDVRAVDDLSFAIVAGTTVAGFLGPNGSGMTTTLRTLVGLVAPTAGGATITGRPYRDLRTRCVRSVRCSRRLRHTRPEPHATISASWRQKRASRVVALVVVIVTASFADAGSPGLSTPAELREILAHRHHRRR